MNTVAAFPRTGVPQEFPGAQNPSTQAFVTNQERAGLCQPGSRPQAEPRPSRTESPTHFSREPGRHAPARIVKHVNKSPRLLPV